MAIGDYLRINTNIGAFNALNALKSVNNRIAAAQLRLATGKRITQTADDPSGYIISTRLNARSRGLAAAIDNVGTAKNVLSIAEGGLLNISNIITTIKEKVTQSLNDTNSEEELTAIGTEISELRAEINDIVAETTFNNRNLLDGTYTNITYQTGERPGDILTFNLSQEHTTDGLDLDPPGGPPPGVPPGQAKGKGKGQGQGPPVRNEYGIPDLDKVDAALEIVLDSMQKIGAVISRLTIKESTLNIANINTLAASSRILDADLAREQLNLTRDLILQQTATAQLAQANLMPQSVLSLFR